MALNSWHGENCDVVNPGALFNTESVENIREELDYLIEHCDEDILIDMSRVEELDSAGIAVLVYFYRRLKLEKREMGVFGLHGKPDELIKMLRIDQAIPQFRDYQDYLTRH